MKTYNFINSENLIKLKQEMQELSYPKFLAYEYKGHNYELNFGDFATSENLENDDIKTQLITKYYDKNTIILFNGELIFNSVLNVKISTTNINNYEFGSYLNSASSNKLITINKLKLNSGLLLKFFKGFNDKITIVVAGNQNLSHYEQYMFASNSDIKIYHYFELFDGCGINYNAHIVAPENCTSKFIQLQNIDNVLNNAFNFYGEVYDNSTLEYYYANLNSANAVNNIMVDLLGKSAQGLVQSINFANKHYSLANHIKLQHLNLHTQSNIDNFGVVNNNAQLVIDGIGVIEKGNIKSVAEQENRIINLSDTARSVANPQLIINEFDVKASHSAAVGRIDEEQLYYIMSRGITRSDATQLIIMSKVEGFLNKIDNDKFNQEVIFSIKEKIKK